MDAVIHEFSSRPNYLIVSRQQENELPSGQENCSRKAETTSRKNKLSIAQSACCMPFMAR